MNKSVIQYIIIIILAHPNFGCTSESGSASKSDDIEVHDDFVSQAANISLVCPSDALVFLIGSSEAASSIPEWNIDTPSRTKVEEDGKHAAAKFQTAIEKAKLDLIAAFARDPKCPKPFELIFASILDGPESLDSSIETTHFGLETKDGSTAAKWKMSGSRNWTLSENSLVPRDAAFELNMATDVGNIIQILAKNNPQSITADSKLVAGGVIIPAQIHYVIKTHGARIATDAMYQPTLENLKEFPRQQISNNQWQSGILMDTHGPTANISSSVFSAHWNPKDILAVLALNTAGEGNSDTAGESNFDTAADGFYDTAGEYGMTSGSKSLAFQEALVKDSETKYLGKRVLGSFATYADLKGTSPSMGAAAHLTFPVGNAQNAGKNLIILDSCYASEKILGALEYAPGLAGKTVVMASVNELYFEFFDYSKLDLAGFLKMPTLLEKLKHNHNLSDGEKELLANMSKGTLAWRSEGANSDFKKLAIWND
jgi:hypothetical protein